MPKHLDATNTDHRLRGRVNPDSFLHIRKAQKLEFSVKKKKNLNIQMCAIWRG